MLLTVNPETEPAVVRGIRYEFVQPPSGLPAVVHAVDGGVHPTGVMQVFVGLQTWPEAHCALLVHSTQLDPLHLGVAPPQATQPPPHCWSVLQGTHWLLLHQVPAPHCALVVQATHCPLMHPPAQGTFVEP